MKIKPINNYLLVELEQSGDRVKFDFGVEFMTGKIVQMDRFSDVAYFDVDCQCEKTLQVGDTIMFSPKDGNGNTLLVSNSEIYGVVQKEKEETK